MDDPATVTSAEVRGKSDPLWSQVLELSCELTVQLRITGFKVRDLIQLAPQMVINTKSSITSDVPTLVNGTLLAWSEFEVVADRLAIRITDFV